jgi:hypothetical protein
LLDQGLDIAKAWELMHDPQVAGNLDTEQYMELCKQAGYTEAETQKAGTRWAAARLERNQKA